MNFDLQLFERWCSHLLIDTKERGQRPLKWIGTQRYFFEEISKGLKDGIHTFVVLKGRQLGISTGSLALDLFWMFMHKGLQGALVTDTDGNKILFKSYLSQYLNSLKGRARVKPLEHNREQLILANRSRLSYIVAGKRKNESLGAGKAVNFMHATECATWGDQDGVNSLMATLAQQNPNRLYVWESTAFGYNAWYELWEQAKAAQTQRAIFIGWWRNEFYRKERDSLEYRTYWDGQLNSDERDWAREVFETYRYEIQPEQWAWYRWYMAENTSDMNTMLQTFPHTETDAFQMSGSKFFSGERINASYKIAVTLERTFHSYHFGLHYEQTQFVDANEYSAQVSIWELPVEGAVYVLGADPAYGSSEWADRFVVSVWRCFSDKLVQVAEVCTDEWTAAQFAWAMAHMAGSYRGCTVNLELQGPGETVLNELDNLRRYSAAPAAQASRAIYDAVNAMREYLWRKQDSILGGFSRQWRSSAKEKIRMMETVRSHFERDSIVVRSPECLQEFRNIHRNGDQIGGEGRAKDDRVIAAGLAVLAWNDWIKNELEMRNRTYANEMRAPDTPRIISAAESAVFKYLQRQGINSHGGGQ